MKESFFIVFCARSGSTSLAYILNQASNCECLSEPSPNLNVETRLMMEGRLKDPVSLLKNTVVKRAQQSKYDIYGDKNATYGPFIEHMYKLLKCKFIFLVRDGRDVIRSLMDWHDLIWGSIYRECKNPGDLTEEAYKRVSNLPVHKDTSDFSRPRPQKGDPYYDIWLDLTREEMCAWYWQYINRLYLNQLKKLPSTAYRILDYTNPTAKDIIKIADFLNLRGLTENKITNLLDSKINSLKNRFGIDKKYPGWRHWSSTQRRQFDKIAQKEMFELGYYTTPETRWRPPNYGAVWLKPKADLSWYQWMYEERQTQHNIFVRWVDTLKGIESIADFGCGMVTMYPIHFKGRKYTGVDLSPRIIEYNREADPNPLHEYLCQDFIEKPLKSPHDLVFSNDTIDNSYDMDEFLASMVKSSKRFIYATCYRGYFPDLEDHKYTWSERDMCFYNDLSPTQARKTLENLGCTNIKIRRLESHDKDIFETEIIAEVPQ